LHTAVCNHLVLFYGVFFDSEAGLAESSRISLCTSVLLLHFTMYFQLSFDKH